MATHARPPLHISRAHTWAQQRRGHTDVNGRGHTDVNVFLAVSLDYGKVCLALRLDYGVLGHFMGRGLVLSPLTSSTWCLV